MAATGKTPILLYGSTTATNTPSAGNLTNSSDGCEIAINVADKNLFFKDSTNNVNTVPIRQSSASSNGWLSSTDWSTFNSKQPAGTYVTSVTGTAPVVSSGGTTPAISMAAATGSVNGYLTSTDWNTFNNKASTSSPTFSGDVTLSTGNLVIGTSGKGIDFSATAGTGTSELLADYEEGTWTPTASRDGSAPTISYTFRSGTYTKMGRVVVANMAMVISSVSAAGSGNTIITGLPYACGEATYSGQAMIGYNDAVANAVYATWISTTTAYFRSGTRSSSNDAGGWATGYLNITFVYEV